MLDIQKKSAALTDERMCSCQKPRVVPIGDGIACVCFERFREGTNEVVVAFLDHDGQMDGPEKVVSGSGKAFMADIHVMGEEIYVVWSEWTEGRWELCLKMLDWSADRTSDRNDKPTVGLGNSDADGQQNRTGEKHLVLASGQGVFHGGITDDGNRLLVYWDELDDVGRNSIQCTYINRRDTDVSGRTGVCPAFQYSGTEAVCISDNCRYYRPVMAFDKTGTLFAVYDYFNGSVYVAALKIRRNGMWEEEILLSRGDGWASDVSMVLSGDTITVSWQEILPKGMVNYWYTDIRVMPDGSLSVNPDKLVNAQIWYAWNRLLQTSGEVDRADQGAKGLPAGGVGQTGGAGQADGSDQTGDADQTDRADCHGSPVQVLLTGHNMSQFYIRLRKPGGVWGPAVLATDEVGLEGAMYADGLVCGKDLFLFYQHTNCNGHQERMASIRLARIPLSQIENMDESEREVRKDDFYMAIPARKKLNKIPEERQKVWLEEHGFADHSIWFGDIHGQSNLSDGLGHVDQYYHYAMTVTGQDFTALTDHDVFPDVITEAEWEYEKTMADAFHQPGRFATLISYEWTSNEFRYDFGHKNVYYSNRDGRIYHASDPEGLTPDRLYERLREAKAMAFPHHPAATWGVVSAATDWDFHDSELERNVEIFSRHAPFEKSGTTSIYAKNKQRLDGKYVQDALKRGYHLGFVAGSDSHQLEHGMEGGILGAYMESLDREHLFEALYRRSVYATTGAPMLLSLKVNGNMMGSELDLEPAADDLTIQIAVLALSPIRETVLVKNNQDIRIIPGAGTACDFTVMDLLENGETDAYYYLRVTLEDEHMGWTSPIWVRRRMT